MLPTLSPELLDSIFTEVDEECDLLSLSLVCKTFKTIIIPKQLHYRTITTSKAIPRLCAHLAQRPGLAERIRKFHFVEPTEEYAQELIEDLEEVDEVDEVDDPLVNSQNLAKAISQMTRLKSFGWSRSEEVDLIVEPIYEPLIFRALSKRDSLIQLSLESDTEAAYGRKESPIKKIDWTWQLPNLKVLILEGFGWECAPNSHMLRFLQSAPPIEILQLPGHTFIDDHNLRLPHLKQINFRWSIAERQQNMYQFLLDHPTIEDLLWWNPEPGDGIPVKPGLLPNLKTLRGTYMAFQFLDATYKQFDTPRWKLESLDINISVGQMNELQCIDRTAIKEFTSWSNYTDAAQDVWEMGRLFPNMEELTVAMRPESMTSLDIQYASGMLPRPFELWLYVLPQFQNLEVFTDRGKYERVLPDDQEFRDTLTKLATLCPRLKRINQALLEESSSTLYLRASDLPPELSGL